MKHELVAHKIQIVIGQKNLDASLGIAKLINDGYTISHSESFGTVQFIVLIPPGSDNQPQTLLDYEASNQE